MTCRIASLAVLRALLLLVLVPPAQALTVAVPAQASFPGPGATDVAWQVLQAGIGGITPAQFKQLQQPAVHDTGRGPIIVRYRRVVSGIEVFDEPVSVVMNRQRRPLAVTGSIRQPDAQPAAGSSGFLTAAGRRFWLRSGTQLVPALLTYRSGKSAEGGPEIRAELRRWPDGALLRGGPVSFEVARDYRVYAGDDPYVSWQPHPRGTPDGSRPTLVDPQVLLRIDELSAIRNDPWLPADGEFTKGNNVDAFFNSIARPDGSCQDPVDEGVTGFEGADFRARLRGGRFDYAYDPAISASDAFHRYGASACAPIDPSSEQLNAKVVQAFYQGNRLHDFFYDVGFDEAWGNAQEDNFGRGGVGGDSMRIRVGSPATFIFSALEGDRPGLSVGVNPTSTSNRDSTLDLSVFAHEWGHHVVQRLVGGGRALLESSQAQSLNEGWADFTGVLTLLRAEDFAGAAPGSTSSYSVGAYTNTDYVFPRVVEGATAPSDPYFYGVRRWPLGPSNPLTFRHIGHNQALPAGFAYFDWKGRSRMNSQVHSSGEIWANTLWACMRAILRDRPERGFEANRRLIAEYLVAGLKITPANPTFHDARDALLLAMRAADERDWRTCRAAFAARGMGSGSVSPPRESQAHLGAVESFSNADLAVNGMSIAVDDSVVPRDADGILDNGETGTVTVTLRHTGFEVLRSLRVLLERSPDYEPIDGAATFADVAPGSDVTARFRVKLVHARNYDPTRFVVGWEGAGGAATARGTVVLQQRTHFDVRAWKGADNAEFAETFPDWRQVLGFGAGGAARTELPEAAAWRREALAGNTVYAVGDRFTGYESSLVSPPIAVGRDFPLVLTFREAVNDSRTLSDGRIARKGERFIEISADGGLTWTGIGTSAATAGFPALVGRRIDLGRGYALRTIQIRFRANSRVAVVGTRSVPVDEAWYVDDIQLSGITGEPFRRVFDEDFR